MKYTDKPTKKGLSGQTRSGLPVLINDKGKCYTVTKAIVDVWNRFDGTKTVKDVVDKIPKTKTINPSGLKTAIYEIVSQLREYDLIK